MSETIIDTLEINSEGHLVASGTKRYERSHTTAYIATNRNQKRTVLTIDLQTGNLRDEHQKSHDSRRFFTTNNDEFTFEVTPNFIQGWENKDYEVTFEFKPLLRQWNTQSITLDFRTLPTSYDRFDKTFDVIYHDSEISIIDMRFYIPNNNQEALSHILIFDNQMNLLYDDDILIRHDSYWDYTDIVRENGKTYMLRSQRPYHNNSLVVFDENFESPRSYRLPQQYNWQDYRVNDMLIEDSTHYIGGTAHLEEPMTSNSLLSMFNSEAKEVIAYQGVIMSIELDDLNKDDDIENFELITMREGLGIEAMQFSDGKFIVAGTYYSPMISPAQRAANVTALYTIDELRHSIFAFTE